MSRRAFDYKRGDFDEQRIFLPCVPLDFILSETDIDSNWEKWKDMFMATFDKFIPLKTIKDTNSPPWIDEQVRHMIRKKYAALRKYRLNKTVERKRKLRNLSQSIKYAVKVKHQQYLAKIEGSFNDNPKLFWSYHKAILHHRTSQSVITCKGITAKFPTEKAELFNSYFSSAFLPNSDANTDSISHFSSRTDMQISDISIGVNEVANCLRNLDTTMACGRNTSPPFERVQSTNRTKPLFHPM